ncbi:MAG: amidohydrolase family protein [Proteobacteria bacterium]|nr:amidohydrolase family protein [Pseudomonadota bacterium]
MRPLAVVNCDVYTPDTYIKQGLVLVQDGIIIAVGRSQEIPLPLDTLLIDAENGRVTPGLIDLALHADHEQTRATPETYGVSSYLRLLTVQEETDLLALTQTASDMSRPSRGARPLGLHVLGRWVSAQSLEVHWRDLWTVSDATLRMLTLPPDQDISEEFILALHANHIIPVVTAAAVEEEKMAEIGNEGGDMSRALARQHGELPPSYHLITPAHLRSTFEPVPQAQASSQPLILTSSADEALSTQTIRQLMAAADMDFAAALATATRHPAELLGLPQGRLTAGKPADLICWTRYGKLSWTMVAGEAVYPTEKERYPRRKRQTATTPKPSISPLKQQALDAVIRFLQASDDTIKVQELSQDVAAQARGIDLSWRYHGPEGRAITALLNVFGDDSDRAEHLILTVESGASEVSGASKVSGASNESGTSKRQAHSLWYSEADWLFYCLLHTGALICLPVRATRHWFALHEQDYPSSMGSLSGGPGPGEGRLVPIKDILQALPRARHIMLSGRPETL